eukprot:4056061-Pleurochrysis_carterae.AAC.1
MLGKQRSNGRGIERGGWGKGVDRERERRVKWQRNQTDEKELKKCIERKKKEKAKEGERSKIDRIKVLRNEACRNDAGSRIDITIPAAAIPGRCTCPAEDKQQAQKMVASQALKNG